MAEREAREQQRILREQALQQERDREMMMDDEDDAHSARGSRTGEGHPSATSASSLAPPPNSTRVPTPPYLKRVNNEDVDMSHDSRAIRRPTRLSPTPPPSNGVGDSDIGSKSLNSEYESAE